MKRIPRRIFVAGLRGGLGPYLCHAYLPFALPYNEDVIFHVAALTKFYLNHFINRLHAV